ncbi:MAG: L,D-transpeptidase family protein [Terriglobia bacterium]|jgi:lipoprotein-anchoring transpeptidase ErfK/SrfK
MERLITVSLLLSLVSGISQARAGSAPTAAVASESSAASINRAAIVRVGSGSSGPAVLRLEILLDRAHFSCGEIDGRYGQNLKNAIEAYQLANQLSVDGVVGPSMWQLLNQDSADAVIEHTISAEDIAGPFDKNIPTDWVARSKLKGMYYASPLQEFTGKYHATEALLRRLNPGQSFDSVGQEILVPNVITPRAGRAASVVVTGLATKDPVRAASVEALGSAGKVLFYATANIGGAHDPLPVGKWKVTDIVHNPWYNYNPNLFWDADDANAKVKIPPGPNGPVGLVWIGISKPHYGLHGASDPGLIGRTHSDGCIRMTNWDALELAKLVGVGTPVIMQEDPGSPGAREAKNLGKARSPESTADLREARSAAKRSGAPQ